MTVVEKISKLRELMKIHGFDAYIIVTDDYHGSEYVGDFFKAREYMSGFTGSAGTLIVTADFACLFTDGRYFLQAEEELCGSGIVLMKMGEEGVPTIAQYLYDNVQENGKIGFDGKTVSCKFASMIKEKLAKKNVLLAYEKDLVDEIWSDRPGLSSKPVWMIDEKYTGSSVEKNIADIRNEMVKQNIDIMLVTALDDVAHILNLRGDDVKCTPVFLSFMIITTEKKVLYINENKLNDYIYDYVRGNDIEIKDYNDIYMDVSCIDEMCENKENPVVFVDENTANYMLINSIPSYAKVKCGYSIVGKMKCVKNETQITNMINAHIKDAIAVTKFIYWLKHNVDREVITEMSAADKLLEFRKSMNDFIEESFEPIFGYCKHGAIVHYEATKATDVRIENHGLLLMDTGAHYIDGTTDITRTICMGELTEEEKRAYTLVLKGHIRLQKARFKYGASGANLDMLARGPLWEAGLDFNHGTGHGVGFVLGVHEGPVRVHFRNANTKENILEEGMIFSNEPGYYEEGAFGIRHENLVVVRKDEKNVHGQFMILEPLTMVPIDKEGICIELINEEEKKYLNWYHSTIFKKISCYFEGEELEWLKKITSQI